MDRLREYYFKAADFITEIIATRSHTVLPNGTIDRPLISLDRGRKEGKIDDYQICRTKCDSEIFVFLALRDGSYSKHDIIYDRERKVIAAGPIFIRNGQAYLKLGSLR